MKNILLISSTAKKSGRLDGVTVKSRVLEEFLMKQKKVNLFSIDSDNYKKEFINIVYKFFKFYNRCEGIIICSSSPGASIILRFLKIIRSKKRIFYFVAGGSLVEKIKKGKYDINLYKNIQKLYVESDDMVNGFKELGIEHVEKLNNFRQVNEFDNKYKVSDKTRLVYYGRVVKEKGIEHAIELVNRLDKEGYDICLDIYGQCKESYKNYLITLINSQVKFCGEIKPNNRDEYETLSRYDVFIFPTEHDGEGLPGALIDAYISGLAVIASNWKYAKEYIDDNQNGYIFEYKNYEDMYLKMKKLIDSNNIKYFKAKSYEKSKEFIVDIVLNEFNRELIE